MVYRGEGSSSTLIYTSELILCFTICVLSATRHNIHMFPYNARSDWNSVPYQRTDARVDDSELAVGFFEKPLT